MVSHSDRHFLYTTDHGKVKTPSLGHGRGFGRDDGQRSRGEAETVEDSQGLEKGFEIPCRGAAGGRRLCEPDNKLTEERPGERSEPIRARVERARENQRQRFANTSLRCNADMGPTEVGVADNARGVPAGRCGPGAGQGGDAGSCQDCAWARAWLQMSARAFHRILKLARTIADLAGSERIETAHLARRFSIGQGGWCRPREARPVVDLPCWK
jgi:hypothetical protein